MKKFMKMSLALLLLALGWTAPAKAADVTVYLNPTGFTDAGARFALYLFGGDEEVTWIDFTASDEEGIYEATFDSETYPSMIIGRMNGSTTENNWDNVWNQSDDLTSPTANTLYTGNGYNNKKLQFTTETPYPPVPLTYTVEGDASLLGVAWQAVDDNVMTEGADGKFTLTKENVQLFVGNYDYKIWRSDDYWIPADANKTLEITENGFYTVTFTFDPATEDLSAAATLVKSFYLADFNLGDSFSCSSDPYFSIARDWKHIAEAYDDDGDPRYMSYTYYNNQGINETGTILAYKQYAQEMGGNQGQKVHDMLVSPKVSGEITLKIKGSTSASSSYPSFIEFYEVNENGTEYGNQITDVIYLDADGNEVTAISTTDWVTAKITVANETRIGVRGQNVYMDNFIAENATVMPEKKLKIVSASPTATTGTIKWDQQPNGMVLVKYTVTVQNTGETDFAVGDNGYSVSIYNRKTGEVYGTTNVPEALAPNATSAEFDVTAEVDPTIWPNSYTYINMDLKENISGSFVMRAQSTYNEYAPKFVFRTAGTQGTSSYYGDIAFGKISEETTKSFEVYNDGTAPLEVKTITVPAGFTVDNAGNFTVAPKAKQIVNITLPITTPGIFSGNLEIVYVDKTGADATYTKAMTGTVLDASKNIITFDDGAGNAAYPQGSVRYTAYISSEGSGDSKNYYLQGSGSNPLYITPLMTAEEGESITFDAEYTNYSSGKVEVMISTDRQNWTTIQTISNISSSYNWTTYTATIPEAGNYYLGFKLTSSKVDNIYGLVYAPAPEHDLLLIGSDIPATATQNADYTATVNVGNVGPNMEAAGSYTASLYVNGEEVATNNYADLPVAVISGNYNNGEEENYTTLTFTYKPHTPGTFPAYIEVKAGDKVVTTDEVSLVIEEEKLSSDITPEGDTTNSYAPVYGLWMDSTGGSFSDFYYTPDQLAKYGIEAGDVITALTYKNVGTSTKTISSLSGTAWVGMENASYITIGTPDKDNMTQVTVFDAETVNVASGLEIVIDLSSNPIVYDGTSSIHVFTNFDGHGSYASMSFSADSNYKNAYYAYGTSPSWNTTGTATPIASFSLAVEPTVLAGTVTDANNAAVEGATVTLRNADNDVEYAATTDAEGKYSINVIQNDKAYKAVVNKEGFVSDVTVIDNFDEEVPLTIREFAYGEVWTGEAANADLSTAHFGNMKAGDKVVVSYTEEPTSDRNVKFTKPNGWSTVYAYAWGGDLNMGWPGTQLSEYYMNEYDQQVYNYTVPDDAIGIIFSDNGENQTPDITNFDVTGYYLDNGELKSWTDNNTAIKLCADNGSVIAEGTLADGTAEFELTDALLNSLSAGLIVSVAGTEANITKVELVELEPITITMSALKYATMYYENVNLVVPEGLVAYAAVVGESVDLQEFAAAGDIIPAGTPVVLGGEAGDYDFCVTTEEGTAPTDNDLVGSEEGGKDQEAGFKYYVLNKKNGVAGFYFQKGSAGAYADVRAHSAYLKVEASQAKANGYGFFDGDATGIDSIESNALTENDKVYTLSGVRVNANRVAKGVYIVNGQKMVIK